jgi:hypothetical protein
LRIAVFEGEDLLVFVDFLGGDLAGDDLAEQAIAHNGSILNLGTQTGESQTQTGGGRKGGKEEKKNKKEENIKDKKQKKERFYLLSSPPPVVI